MSKALEQMSDGVDLVIGVPPKFGAAAFALDSPLWAYPRNHRIAWWGGQGSSLGFVDFDERMSVSFMMNRWLKGPCGCLRQGRKLAAVYESLSRR